MKTKFVAALVLGATIALGSTAFAQATTADGVVKKVDTSANKITIQHGPIPAFDMPDPMTMVYRVKDPALLKTVKAGDKVTFDAERVRGQLTITKIEKAK